MKENTISEFGAELLYVSEGASDRDSLNGFDARIQMMLQVSPEQEAEIVATQGLVENNHDLVGIGHEILDIIFKVN